MKFRSILLMSLFLCAGTVHAETLFDCDLTLFNKNNGANLGGTSFVVTYDDYVPVRLPNPLSGLNRMEVRMTEGGGEHDGWLELVVKQPFSGFFNAAGFDATFGDEAVFGKIQCKTVSSEFYFKTAAGVIFLGTTVKSGLYQLLSAEGTCVAGDPDVAARELSKHWYFPVYDVNSVSTIKSDRDGIHWLEIKKEGVDPIDVGGDLPVIRYQSWKEISRVERHVPVCR
jgi:hypothetical protein